MYQRMGLTKYSGSNWHNNYDNRTGQIIAIEPYNEFGVELLYGVGIGDVDIIINRDGLKRISKIKYVLLKKELNVKDF